ncbi:MAG TPA: APC family permease [Gammaproteobacteria bacterium]|nr:APC family permease [Gammaproteobacteria bacterium]
MTETDASAGGFKKDLGFFSLLAMSLGTVIGSGWLLLPSVVAAAAGPISLVAWVIAGLIMLIVCLVYAELGAAWPAAGAVALYPQLSHGSFTGHIGGWAAFISYVIIPPAEAVAVTRYASAYVPEFTYTEQIHNIDVTHLTGLGLFVAVALLGLLALLNYVGVKYLGIFQNWVTSIKYIPIVLFIVIGGIMVFDPVNFTAYGGFAPYGASGLFLGTAATVFAYTGFRQALDFGAEAKNPGRDLPLALICTVLIAMVTYVLIAAVFIGGIDWQGLSSHGVVEGQWHTLADLSAPLYDMLIAAGIGTLAFILFLDGILSPNGPNATNTGAVPRVLYTMAENKSMPKVFLKLNPKRGTPGWGLGVCFLVEIGFLLLSEGGYGALITAANVAFMVAYAMGPVSCGGLRKIAPHVKRPFRLPLVWLFNPLAFILASFLLYWEGWPSTGLTLGILFIGVLIYVGYGLAGRVNMGTVRYGIWLIAYLIIMAVLSYLGSSHFGGIGVIPYGWDIGVVAVVCIGLYYWGVHQSVQFERDMGTRARREAKERREAVEAAREERE